MHCVDRGLRLLVDLLLHEMVEFALHDFRKLNLKSLDGALRSNLPAICTGQTVNVEFTLSNVSNIIILQIEDMLGVLDDSSCMRGDKESNRLRHAMRVRG